MLDTEEWLDRMHPYIKEAALRASSFNRDYYMDFYQCGSVGLVDACGRHNGNSDDFESYVRIKISGAITDEYRKQILRQSRKAEVSCEDPTDLYDKRYCYSMSDGSYNALSLIRFYELVDAVGGRARDVFVDHCVFGYSLREVSKRTGCEVHHIVKKAKARLRDVLALDGD